LGSLGHGTSHFRGIYRRFVARADGTQNHYFGLVSAFARPRTGYIARNPTRNAVSHTDCIL
jgi:hypothetical protein